MSCYLMCLHPTKIYRNSTNSIQCFSQQKIKYGCYNLMYCIIEHILNMRKIPSGLVSTRTYSIYNFIELMIGRSFLD